ncbi:MAG: sigma 54-interacting transcriptional regulator, partial [Myxococcota bacterium]
GVSMRRLRESLWNNIFTHDLLRYATILHRGMEDFSTFILGETGTGKTAAAAAIGRSGYIPFDRTNNDFVASFTECFLAANLSAIPSTLLESELFGHAKGAFTGAVEAHRGLFSRCSPHGSIFLDEIGEVSLQVQIKLLHVLQDRKFSPVGSHDVQRFEGRVIVATNRSLEEMAASGSLRADLFYRLSSDVIEVPSLQDRFRESPEELSQMVDSLLERMLGEADSSLSEQVLAIIARDIAPDYAWPGNVRELEQCIRRILLRGDAAPSWPHRGSRASGSTYLWQATEEGQWPVQALIEAYCRLVYEHEGSYEQAGQRLGLDWRTVKRHVQATG